MPETSLVHLEVDEPGIALLSMRDQDSKNSFHEVFIEELLERLAELAGNPSVKVCVLQGLPEVFCAGAHKELLLDLSKGKMEASDILLPKVLLDLPIPTIAAMEGHAVGGGLAMALCCDVLLMARESRYGCSFMNMGFTPGMGITRLLQLGVGEFLANEMMYGGQFFKGAHFEGRGSINYVLPRARIRKKAMQVAGRIAEKPRHALELLKRNLSLPRRRMFEETITSESAMHRLSFAHPETARLIREQYAGKEESTDGSGAE